MVNSISTSYIRGLCDEMGYTSKIDTDGDIQLRLNADSDFGHDVLIFLEVKNNWLRVFALADFTIEQHQVAKTLIKLNEYNKGQKLMNAYLAENGRVLVERAELIDENVSEEFIKENCIKLCLRACWQFFKENFAEY